ncbi:DUF6406 domain-containing protein [Streptomyces sp. NPDC050121]|uniref:DUF6406 domain-containing protein n=1 Tax=Streptomyces sp. NPDC050121 TaxID=3365601 RepID=UPI00379F86B4
MVKKLLYEVRLRLAIPERRNEVRYVLRHVYAPDGGPITVYLTVAADEVKKHVLEVGGTFSVRDETWVVDRVDVMSDDARVVLRRVE